MVQRVEYYLARPLGEVRGRTLSITAVVSENRGGGLKLRVVTSTSTGRHEKVLHDDDCGALAEAAAFIVALAIDPDAATKFDNPMGARAEVRTKHGTFEKIVGTPKGEPETFLTADELRAKFDGLVGLYLTAGRLDQIAASLLSLETANDIGEVLRLTRSDGAVPLRVAAGEN